MKKSDSNRLQSTAIEELDGGSAARLPSTAIEGPRRQSGRRRSAALAALLFAAPSALAAGPAADSAPMRLDLRESPRLAADGETFALAYSPRWGGAANCSITADGNRLLSNATDAGTLSWTARGVGRHALSFTAGALVYDAAFTVLGDDAIAIDSNRLQSNATWASGKTWVVTAPLSVPSGITLTIEPGAVVKFMDGAGLAVESGGACIARGVVFTHIADDTAGGDTMMDGDETSPVAGAYTLTGSITEDDATEERYMPPQTLTSSITSDTRLRGHRCYIVSNSVTVASGATLTLQPGTVIKFNTGCQMTVNGTLSAQGTRAAPIVFTSLKDDAHGGDTNGDGEKTYAAGGDWNGLWVYSKADLAYAKLMYSGNGNERGIAQVQSGGILTMTGCTVAHAKNDGLWNWGGSISATNTVFTDLGWATAPYRGSKNEYVNCVFYGNDVGLCYWSHWSGAPTYRNCVFASCAHGWCELASGNYGDPPSSVTVANCVFFNPDGYRQQSTAFDGKNGNIYADPLFLDPEGGDFRIAANSPCVDAADSAAAPELDFYGQPRTTVRPAPSGTSDALGRNADIGIHEFYPSNAPGIYDLSAKAVATTATSAAPGESIAVTWTVGNAGKRAVPDPWHDALYLVSDSGKSYALGEPLNPGALAAGASRETTATFPVPVVPAGSYRLRLSVNSRRSEIPEGSSTGNNAALSETSVAIAIPATAASDGAIGSVAPGAAKVVAFDIPSGSGDLLLRVSAPAGGSGLSARVGLGFQPTDSGSGTALAFANGEGWLMVPAGTERVYLVVENGGASAASFSADFRAGSLSLASVSPSSLPASGAVTLQIAGAGFADGCAVLLGGSSAAVKAVRCVSSSLLAATIDCAKLSAGSRLALSVAKGAETKTLENAVAVSTAAGAGKFWAKLNVPDSVREGRLVQECFVEYGNDGTADVPSPIVQVVMEGNGTLGYVGGLSGQKTLQFVAAGGEGSAGVLRPGETHRIRFALRAGSRNSISLHSSVGSDYAPAPWTSAADYLAGLSAAATRIGLRGQDATDYEEVLSLAKALKNGENCAVICGRFADSDGTALAGVLLAFADASSGTVLHAATDSQGRFKTGVPAPSGTYAVSCTGIPLADDCGVATVAGGKDTILSLSAAECAIARVTMKGGTDGLVAIATDIDTDASWPGVAGIDGFEFRGLPDGSYRVELFRDETLVFFGRILVEGGEILSEPLEYDGSAPGTLVLFTDAATAAAGAGFFVFSSDSGYLRLVFADETAASATLTIPAGTYNIVLAGTDGETAPNAESVVVPGSVSSVHLASTRSSSALSLGRALRTSSVGIDRRGSSGEANDVVSRSQRAYNKALQLKNVPLNPPKGDRDCIHNRDLYKYYSSYRDKFCATFADFVKIYYQYVDATKAYIYQNNSTWMGVIKDCYGILAAGAFKGASAVTTGLDMIFESAANGDISRDTFFSLLEENGIPVISQGGKVAAQGEKVWRILQEFSSTHMFELQYNLHKRTMENTNLPRFEEWIAQFEQFLIDNDNYAYWECCPMILPETPYQPPMETKQPSVPQSCDPNEMAGPLGTGANRSVLPGDWCEYTVYFENQTNATAAAAEVRVTAQLSDQLDWSTFETVAVSFGDQTDVDLAGKANGTSDCPVPGTNHTVHSEVALDVGTGAVAWYLRIVDPDGDEDGWPLDVYGGFLPPNDPETHCGEGHITYRVKVRDDAEPGARIDASATIVFDYNDPIPTDPAWWNTVAYTTYRIRFDANGGTGKMAEQTASKGANAKLSANKFTKSGCVFLGWAKSKTGAVAYANKAKVRDAAAAGKTLTLYAQWAKSKYTVKFNAYGGKLPKGRKMAAQTMAYGKAAKLRKNAFTRSGYVFAGWATSKANAKKGVIAYKNAQSVKNLRVDGKATTLYAVWAKPKYKVAFYANGGKGATVVQTLKYGKAAKLAKCKFKAPKGRKFAGWATSAANAKAGKVKYKNAQAVKNLIVTGKTVKLYAVWKMK